MSYSSLIKDYLRTIVTTVDSTVYEWTGFFDLDNLPRNVKSKSYHIDINLVNSNDLNDHHVEDSTSVFLYVVMKGKRNEVDIKDDAYDLAHNIRMEAVKQTNAIIGTNIKNVSLNSLEIEDRNEDDNSVILKMDFTFRLIFS